jgi:hypothetical protein
MGSLARFATSFVSEALTEEEKSWLTIRLYGSSAAWLRSDLFAWEKTWYQRRLPLMPARVLVGACGAGREPLALLDAGYCVDAFEPAPALVAVCRERLAGRARVFAFRYQDLSACVLDRRPGSGCEVAAERYDAVLFGWGSLSHVGSAAERERLLRAVDRLCPGGPILASFWRADEPSPFAVIPYGRAARLGGALGKTVRQARRLPHGEASHELFAPNVGFGYALTLKEVQGWATLLCRGLAWDAEVGDQESWIMPHMTLLPRPPPHAP